MTRSDTDSLRKGFITAGYMFGVDINVDSISNCNRVIFELRYTHPELIKFSAWSAFYTDEEKFMVVNPQSEITGGYGSVYVAVIIGENRLSKGINDPRAIHLDFVVSQSATHNTAITYDFLNPFAIVVNNDIDSNVTLESENTTMNVHGYVDVWPGDADNSGTVTNEDFTQIVKLLGYGFDTKKTKCFKRRSASSLWKAQPVLAWDSIVASHADTDGNGYITVDDCLIVFLNFKKTKTAKFTAEPVGNFPPSAALEPAYQASATKRIPVYFDGEQSYIAVAGSVGMADPEARILGVERGGQLGAVRDLFFKISDDARSVDFTLGTTQRDAYINRFGEQLMLVCETNSGNTSFSADMKAISPEGNIFSIPAFTPAIDLETRGSMFSLRNTGDNAIIKCAAALPISAIVYNNLGECVGTYENCAGEIVFNTSAMATGCYFVECRNGQVVEMLSLPIVR